MTTHVSRFINFVGLFILLLAGVSHPTVTPDTSAGQSGALSPAGPGSGGATFPPAQEFAARLAEMEAATAEGQAEPSYHFASVHEGSAAISGTADWSAEIVPDGLSLSFGDTAWSWRFRAVGREGGQAAGEATAVSGVRVIANRAEIDRPGLTEWYVHNALGLQQGWTVSERPAGGSALLLALESNLPMLLDHDARGFSLLDSEHRLVARYSGLLAYDARRLPLPVSFQVDGGAVVITVQDQAAIYPVTIDPFFTIAQISTSGLSSGAEFGRSVSVSDDGEWVAVGGPSQAVSGQSATGVAYLVQRPAGGWSGTVPRTVNLSRSSFAPNANFGKSVAMSGDGTTVVVGAPGGAFGLAYVYQRPAGGWPASPFSVATLNVGFESSLTTGRGNAVAISRDGSVIAVGASNSESQKGRALVYIRPAGGWLGSPIQSATLKSDLPSALEELGASLAMVPDGSIIVAGSRATTHPGTDLNARGGVHVFLRPVAGWSGLVIKSAFLHHQGTVDALAPHFGGTSVDISDDGKTIVSGAPNFPANSIAATGALFVFARADTNWSGFVTPSSYLSATFNSPSQFLGTSVGIDSSAETIFGGGVGALGGNGAVFVYRKPVSGWTGNRIPELVLTPDALGTSTEFGRALAVSSDGATVAVGDPSGGGSVGAAFVYAFGGNATTTAAGAVTPSPVIAGQLTLVNFSVTSPAGTPTGLVEITDGTVSCLATVDNGKCGITFPTPGPKAVLIRYLGSGGYLPSATALLITVAAPPAVSGVSSEVLSSRSAIIRGTVDPRYADTQVTVDWGVTPGGPYPNSLPATPGLVPAVAKVGATPMEAAAIEATLAGLSPNTTYFFKIRGQNVAGTGLSSEASFATSAAIVTLPVAVRSYDGW